MLDQIRSSGFTKIAFEIKSQAAAGVPAPRNNNGRTFALSSTPEMAGWAALAARLRFTRSRP
jgi:hypothetical protein